MLRSRRGSQPVSHQINGHNPHNEKNMSAPIEGIRNNSQVNATVSYEMSASMLQSNMHDMPYVASARQMVGKESSIAILKQDPKRLLKDARNKRAVNINSALAKDVDDKKNRVKYLQNLQQDRISKKKLE